MNDETKVKNDEDASAPDIEKDIAKTRASMSSTLGELHGKLNPAVLKDQALEQFQQAKEALKTDLAAELREVKMTLRNELRDAKSELREATIGKVEHMVDDAKETVSATGNSLLGTMRDNPIPTALVGLGLGWLFINARARRPGMDRPRAYGAYGRVGYDGPTSRGTVEARARQLSSKVGNAAEQVGEKASDVAHRMADRAVDGANGAANAIAGEAHDLSEKAGKLGAKAGDAVTHAVHDAEDFVSANAHRAGESATMMVRGAREQAVEWEGSVERALRANPLAVGAVALALGVAVGLAVPSTPVEDEWVGGIRDRTLDRAGELANEALQSVEGAATEAIGQLQQSNAHA